MDNRLMKAARVGVGWTQKDLADAAKVHPQSVVYWETKTKQSTQPNTPAFFRMVEALERKGVRIEGRKITFPD